MNTYFSQWKSKLETTCTFLRPIWEVPSCQRELESAGEWTSLALNCCNQAMLPVMILTGRLISCSLRYQTLSSLACRFLTFLSHLNLPFPLLCHVESRTKPKLLDLLSPSAMQKCRISESVPFLQTLKRAPPLLSMYGKSGVHTEDEPEWLTSGPTDNERLGAESKWLRTLWTVWNLWFPTTFCFVFFISQLQAFQCGLLKYS